jgi:hypothetical protein
VQRFAEGDDLFGTSSATSFWPRRMRAALIWLRNSARV